MRPSAFALLCVLAAVASAAAENLLPSPPPPVGLEGTASPLFGALSSPPGGWTAPVPDSAAIASLDEDQFITTSDPVFFTQGYFGSFPPFLDE